MKFTSYLVVALATLACLWAWPAAAEWPHDPTENVPICNAANGQYDELVVSDGEGGAVIVWRDIDVYAQRIGADGVVQWTTDGVPLCTATGTQWYLDVVTDGAGGVIVTWEDQRTTRDIYAQRVDASGNRDVDHGRRAHLRSRSQSGTNRGSPPMEPEAPSSCGRTARNSNQDVYAQRIDASGAVQWVEDGVPVCTDATAQYDPRVSSDGDGGAYFAWQDFARERLRHLRPACQQRGCLHLDHRRRGHVRSDGQPDDGRDHRGWRRWSDTLLVGRARRRRQGHLRAAGGPQW